MAARRTMLATLLLVSVLASPSFAVPLRAGNASGVFVSPALVGGVRAQDGSLVALDNSATAVVAGIGTARTEWGFFDVVQFPGVVPAGVPVFSAATYVGRSFSAVDGQSFVAGTISFSNGASANETLIFGITLELDLAGRSLVLAIGIVATVNGLVSPATDADHLTFTGSDATLHALEGATVTAHLLAWFDQTGKPRLAGLALSDRNPDGSASSGFIGVRGRPVGSPAGLALFAAGLVAMAMVRRGGSSRRAAQAVWSGSQSRGRLPRARAGFVRGVEMAGDEPEQ